MTKSQQHLTDTTLTLFISVFLSLEITFCLCFFFQLFVVMQFERTGGFFSTIFYSAA